MALLFVCALKGDGEERAPNGRFNIKFDGLFDTNDAELNGTPLDIDEDVALHRKGMAGVAAVDDDCRGLGGGGGVKEILSLPLDIDAVDGRL